jgi:hypothetical protein
MPRLDARRSTLDIDGGPRAPSSSPGADEYGSGDGVN